MSWWAHLGALATAFLIQVTVAPGIGSAGTRPDFILVWIICAAILERKDNMAIFAAAVGGAFVDLTVGRFLGLNLALFIAAEIVARNTMSAFMRPSAIMTAMISFSSALIIELLRGAAWLYGGNFGADARGILTVGITSAAATTVLTVILYYILLSAGFGHKYEKS